MPKRVLKLRPANGIQRNSNQSTHSSASVTATPFYYPSALGSLFGWLHSPCNDKADFGLVLCNPFGYEALCAHRSFRTFAETASSIGVPTLRFDYLGTGDSADADPDANQLDVWTGNVLDSISELKRLTGVSRVCLLGARLGGLLAMRAACECAGIASLILIAPVFDGFRYLRELRVAKLAGDRKIRQIDPPVEKKRSITPPELEVNGFSLTAATVDALAKTQILAGSLPSTTHTLVIDGASLRTSREWAAQIASRADGQSRYIALPGLVGMLMRSPMRAEVPLAMVSAVGDWLSQLSSARRERSVNSPGAMGAPSLSLPGPQGENDVIETPVSIFTDTRLFGVVSTPKRTTSQSRGILLLNSGADSHSGASRLHVQLSRRWARSGHVVLRLDLGGLGDSETRPGCRADDVFPIAALREIGAATDYLRTRHGVEHVTVGGLCSGGYHALQAAISGTSVNQIFLVNPQMYFWGPGMQLSDWQLTEVMRKSSIYLSQALFYSPWQWLFRSKVRIVQVLRSCLSRSLVAIEYVARRAALFSGHPLPHDLSSQLADLARRRIDSVVVFADSEPDIRLLNLQGLTTPLLLHDGCRVHIVKGGDHTFSDRHTRDLMSELLSEDVLSSPAIRRT